jgi:hypothetical protein
MKMQLNVVYEYPMDENASVCGFEAEISNQQHLDASCAKTTSSPRISTRDSSFYWKK